MSPADFCFFLPPPSLLPLFRPANTLFTKMTTSSPIDPSRLHTLNSHSAKTSGSYLLYWMQQSLRTLHNPSLEHAAHLSNLYKKPLRIAHIFDQLAEDSHPLPERHALFNLQALRDVEQALEKRAVPFTVISAVNVESAIAKLAEDAVAVVTDVRYLKRGRRALDTVAKTLQIPVCAVESDIVVPVGVASVKAEHAARTIRPKIESKLKEYLVDLSKVDLKYQDGGWGKVEGCMQLADLDACLEGLESLDLDGRRVAMRGGEIEAGKVLKWFLEKGLGGYGDGRNEPSGGLQSGLSPYLRGGMISPVHVALSAKKVVAEKGGKYKESGHSFLEELIVRRELAVNMCWFNGDGYDDYEAIVPAFAKKSLEEHKEDKREKLYSYEELEAGMTQDVFWNAAQLEMVASGKMHGYMRMYWAKQIIGWVENPKVAMEYALRLNNRWELDAVDPNSYAGVIWCFGLHDQGWKERPVWGKVRYMNAAGLKRKYDMVTYVEMVNKLVLRDGLPPHIAELRKDAKPLVVQQTIQQALKRSRSKTSTKAKATKASKTASNSAARDSLLNSIKRLKP